jgi:hypothetical protein
MPEEPRDRLAVKGVEAAKAGVVRRREAIATERGARILTG